MSRAIRVLVVDDDPLVRAGLSMMLHGAQGLEVVGEAADGTGVPEAVSAHSPDVVLMDLRDAAAGRYRGLPGRCAPARTRPRS